MKIFKIELNIDGIIEAENAIEAMHQASDLIENSYSDIPDLIGNLLMVKEIK